VGEMEEKKPCDGEKGKSTGGGDVREEQANESCRRVGPSGTAPARMPGSGLDFARPA